MDLGTFSVSLNVADLAKSKEFYSAFGFEVIGGDQDQGWLILKNGSAKIGLFQKMFEKNILTFNTSDARAIEQQLNDQGISISMPTKGDEGPCSFMLEDPDGNPILVDQH
jgi:catechol 2,3-dioxygenase-like lactoylglutathione lyase family enzyme